MLLVTVLLTNTATIKYFERWVRHQLGHLIFEYLYEYFILSSSSLFAFAKCASSPSGYFPSPGSAVVKGYRGVVATKDIATGVALVRIARSCCIGPETTDASKDAWRRAMASADEVNTTHRLLSFLSCIRSTHVILLLLSLSYVLYVALPAYPGFIATHTQGYDVTL